MSNFSAVLVGINKYQGAPLRGCVNDVTIMRDILVQKYGVPANQIRLLLDERATKEGILERLKWLATCEEQNKLFYYSGHGAQYPNQPYDKTDWEPDGMDEILCPVDFNWQDKFITDDVIDAILDTMPGGHHMSMIFDCCHSGTIDRGVNNPFEAPAVLKNKKLDMVSKHLPTPLDLMSRMSENVLFEPSVDVTKEFEEFDLNKGFLDFFAGLKKTTNKRKPNDSKHNVSIITGCKDDQTSADAWVGNRYQGALSFVIQGLLLKEPTMDLRQLRKQAAKLLAKYGFDQVPQLSCSTENLEKKFIQV